MKKQKSNAKRYTEQEESSPVCSSCHQEGHMSSRSKGCPNHKLTKQEQVLSLLGDNTTSVTRKIKLDTIPRPEYETLITNKVLVVSEYVRNIMIRAQLFVNYYVITHVDQAIDKNVFTQNFWYCTTQLVLGKSPKNTKALPSDFLDS